MEHHEKSQNARTYLGSVERGSVSDARRPSKNLITIKVVGKDVRIKEDTSAEATVVPYQLYKKLPHNEKTNHTSSGLCMSPNSVQEPKIESGVPCCPRKFYTTSWV